MRRLEGKLAVVTGAANGIGRASALRFASEGANLAIIDMEEEGLAVTADKAREAGATVLTITANCTDEDVVADAFKRIYAEAGFVDILMNNVGQSARQRASEFYASSSEVWRFVLEVSLMSTLISSRQVVPAMREAGKGKIVNVASNAGLAGEVGLSEYAAAKMGVIGFTRSLARELAPFRVNVNAICPGVTKTRIIGNISEDILEKIRQSIPLGFFAEPEDIAATAAFLASEDSRYMTGQSVVVDGGRWMV
ncbi:SDR family NAD(P)-dependent oxidoreductase [Microvirga antarctica]|uniref:SDR family NAD(P)-dependent oxidoreductase n=1 Tax=Microvirga antarctica TaxID=2819233 RepID=UPI001B30B6D2|nr:SDR family oxidoreductase [Microvirga antarctica]